MNAADTDLGSCGHDALRLQAGQEVVHACGSRLRNPRRFMREWRADVRSCRPTARRLFLRHLAQQYRHSSLGLLWAFAPSALAALVLIGGQRAHIVAQDVGVPTAFYGVFGLALAQTFLESLNTTRRVFTSHQQLLRRQNVPLDGLIVAGLLDVAFTLVVRGVIVATLFLVFSVRPSLATLPLAVAGFLGVGLLGAGIGLLVAPLNSLNRDIEHVFSLFPWVLIAVTPVFVPLPSGSRIGSICAWNPLTQVFEGIRSAAYGGEANQWAAAIAVVCGCASLAAGWLFCRIARPHVVERMLG